MSRLESIRSRLASIIAPRDHGGPVRWMGEETVIRERDRQFLILAMAVKSDRGVPENIAGVLYEFDATDILRYIDNHDRFTDADYADIRDALESAPKVEYDLTTGEYQVVSDE